MGKIVSIEENQPHVVSETMCVNCKHRYIDVRPEGVLLKNLICPHCKQAGYMIETGEWIANE